MHITSQLIVQDNDILHSLCRAMAVLEAFTFEESELSIIEIVEKSGLPKTTAFRAIKTFEAIDYLCYEPSSRKYTLSPKLFRLGSIAINSKPLPKMARPIMEKIRNDFGETVHLNIRQGYERMCIETMEGHHVLQVGIPIGHRSPLHAGATALVLLAGMEDTEIAKYFAQRLMRLTDNTVTDPKELWRKIHIIRENGYALSYGERIYGVCSISVPIYDNCAKTIASLSILIPNIRVDDEVITKAKASLIQTSRTLSRKLGCFSI